ncbi:MAG: anti-sigma factor antagonist [Lachnospiraceae bacterium]|nr:anti-sigma factor antagonist [Lachnospiraceae bacterium]
METAYHMQKQELIVPMPKELDHHAAKTLGREIDFLVGSWQIKRLVLDFTDTQFMDSSGIGVIIGRKKTMDLYGGQLVVTHLGERARQIFEKSGLLQLVETVDDGEER